MGRYRIAERGQNSEGIETLTESVIVTLLTLQQCDTDIHSFSRNKDLLMMPIYCLASLKLSPFLAPVNWLQGFDVYSIPPS